MSDPMTNVEIEDVLSSIRRLVSDGEKARTHDSAPEDREDAEGSRSEQDRPEAKSDRLILTPAFLVAVEDEDDRGYRDEAAEKTEEEAQPEPLTLTGAMTAPAEADDLPSDALEDAQPPQDESADDQDDVIRDAEEHWDEDIADVSDVEDSPAEASEPDNTPTPTDDLEEDVPLHTRVPERSELVATIAELEAAMDSESNDYEPEGNQPMTEDLDNTIAWPGTSFRRFDDSVEDAEMSGEDASGKDDEDAPEQSSVEAADPVSHHEMDHTADDHNTDDHVADDHVGGDHEGGDYNATDHEAANQEDADQDDAARMPEADPVTDAGDEYDDDLDGLLDAGGVALDEEALRALVAEVVREELMGPLGERITRNVRKLVRREIYRVLSSQDFD